MSMLTPPGMGGQYRITGERYPRMRRGRRRGWIVSVCVASVVALGVIGWGTLQLVGVFTGDGGKASAASAGCAPSAKPSPGRSAGVASRTGKALPRPAGIKVNVFNATPRSGLAKKTADELRKRGFTIGQVGNAPKEFDKKVPGPGLVLGAKTSAQGALPVLATQLAGAQQRTDARGAGDVDLILGTAFTKLTPQAAATQALSALTSPSPAPSPSSC